MARFEQTLQRESTMSNSKKPIQFDFKPALQALTAGELILYPTDTIWGIGCDATNAEAVEKVYKLKRREESKAMVCLVQSEVQLERYCQAIPDVAYDIYEFAEKPTTLILDQAKGIAPNAIAEDGSCAFRIPKDNFCQKLLQQFKKPLIATSANISGQPAPKGFKEIQTEILEGVSYVVPLPDNTSENKPSTIIKIAFDCTMNIIRA